MLPWFVRDYIAATRHLSLAERGAYTDLLFLSWEMGPLPSDPTRLARLIGVSAPEFKRVWLTLRLKFAETEKGLVNTRLEQHRAESMDRSAKARSSAQLRWERARQSDGNANASTNASANAHPNADANAHAESMLPSPSPSPSTNQNPKSARTSRRDTSKPVSAAVLLGATRNVEKGAVESEAEILNRTVVAMLQSGSSPDEIVRTMPARGLTLEQVADIAREHAP
jgi:uncharacterized protein YdaU (DUF1376 family)